MAAEPIEISASVEFDLESLFGSASLPVVNFDFGPDALPRQQSAEGAIARCGNVQGSHSYPTDAGDNSWMDGLELFLRNDEDDTGVVAVEDFLVDSLDGQSSSATATSPSGVHGYCGEGDGASINGAVVSTELNEGEIRHKKCEDDVLQGRGEVEEDKKRRRQLRNRDSAMKSRERRKLYVHDLEIKNKYLESECRRLEYLLHCCAAENLALHQHLQKGRMTGASGAKQESAVLFMKPLLLGSLFWLTSIVYLFLAPNLLAQRPEMSRMKQKARGLPANLRQEIEGAKEVNNRQPGRRSTYDLVFMRRRCKALRTKIKVLPVGLSHACT